MAIGDVSQLSGLAGYHYVDTGMYAVPEYGSVYLIDDDRPTLVDTGIGADADRIFGLLDAAGVAPADLSCIAVTHVHLDHAGGVGRLLAECPNAEVYVHDIGVDHLADPSALWAGTKDAVGEQIQFYAEPKPVPEDRITGIADGDEIAIGDRTLRAHHAPGHAPHQVVFEVPEDDAVFTADAAGIYSPSTDSVHVTSPPPQFDLEQALADVAMLQDIDPEWLLYAHFGPAGAGDRLATYADRLEAWVADVAEARADASDDAAVVEQFREQVETPATWSETKARAEVGMNVRGVLAYLDR
jgi:glyoxylase-like metal-dependent hydrolase (beta-lactamase superfamily II)